MRLTTVFNELLAMQVAFVSKVEFGPAGIVVDGARRQRRRPRPRCVLSTRVRYHKLRREWRHVALGKWRVVIRATLSRPDCPEHGVVTEAISSAEHESRFTRDFEDLVAWVARELNKTAAKNLLHIAWPTVGTIIERVVVRKHDRIRLERLYGVGIDDVSYRKSHKYLTLNDRSRSGNSGRKPE